MKKTGVFGGTFSPPHYGHIAAAESFARELSLDTLIIMPANIPPHKQNTSIAPYSRYEMAKLAFEGMEKATVSDYEISTPGKSYTANTLTHLHSDDTELYFLCGTDMFTTLEHWYRPDIICSLATIVLAKRDTDNDEEIEKANKTLKSKFSAKTIVLTHTPKVLSSSLVRDKISNGEDVSSLVPPSVLDYINQNGLYKKI